MDKQLVFKLYSRRNSYNLDGNCKDGTLPFSNYVEKSGKDKLLPFLNDQLKIDQLTSANFNDFIKFSCHEGGIGECEIFDNKSKTWSNCEDIENGDIIVDTLTDFYYNSVLIDFEEDQHPEWIDKEITFYTREYLDDSNEIMIGAEDLSVFEDEIKYVLKIDFAESGN